ncbi:Na+/H+ antiporter family protein [Aggregatibacter actinomycetemcomitans]|uniref:Na+/H+ antiporter family protein n=1 Tax=Aggregatibacter actinomycetemcomitans TaxID=714 RepID=UPI00022AD4CD|nr:Na+/H+ antiporter family protein [Aggregatibacter actinomycetemcomitans]KOE63441.1 sodium:proton antiporter [Aggregatibacter actinomycetemcomitans serotype e str. A160]KOE67989.1 sodium:proton antiporter [Aggregatibacter actinomycetemcomitans serotype e str. SCC393]KYK77462.1 sodium:proton antiporter [Aggregatibacter actinomycetemcomitans serotype e str. SA2876]QEH45205.1 Na+/H+ antiporter family protein [Aggregatibacter actinomycetemcomitans]QEH49874.1 Na+/H+ antiporter family protein [Agg
MLTNPVVISIIVLLALSLLRINVVIALVISALTAGLVGDLGLTKTIEAFTGGLGGGAEVAMNYAMLGAFAIAISKSGITDLLAYKIITRMNKVPTANSLAMFKYAMLGILTLFAISSQNLLPVHIAFIPIVIPPMLAIFNKLKIDRRAVACVLTFGLTATYMLLPVGFGKIFIESILVKNINTVGSPLGLQTSVGEVSLAMTIPVIGMVLGLLTAVFITYRKPREYVVMSAEPTTQDIEQHIANIKPKQIVASLIAIVATFTVQLVTSSTIIGGLVGLIIFVVFGIFKLKESNDIFQQGLRLMAMIGFVMIAASGFANVINTTTGVKELIDVLSTGVIQSKGAAAFLMLLVGLLITMGIGSSFSTVPIITSIYVPLCLSFGFSPLATVSIVGVAAALGDSGSPASDSTLGPTSGLNMDGKHDHIWDSVVPTFIHYNIPLIIFGWIAAVYL